MSLDRMQSRHGLLVLNPEPGFTVNSSLSSIASNQNPGGLLVGNAAGFAPSQASAGLGGGALFMIPTPPGTAVNTTQVVTGGTLAHNGAGILAFSATVTANNLQLQGAQFPGQFLLLHNCGATTCSIASLATVPAFNITTASTQTCWMNGALSLATGAKVLLFAALHSASATSHYPNGIWVPLLSTV